MARQKLGTGVNIARASSELPCAEHEQAESPVNVRKDRARSRSSAFGAPLSHMRHTINGVRLGIISPVL